MIKAFLNRYFPLLLLLVVFVNATGLFSDVMESDGTLYATISKHIAVSGDWLNLYAEGGDWLDKPHLPFWITAVFFKIFGVTAFAYKLPAFIAFLFTLYFIYKTGFFVYDRVVAQLSVLIYGSAVHVIIGQFDVRAEPYLTLFIIAAIYFLMRNIQAQHLKWIILAAMATAAAIMTKGLFTLITIGSGILLYHLRTGTINKILHYQWLVFVMLTLVFILPELFSVYQQFDLHPEKQVFGRTRVSGVRFFLWDSQFGRFFNTGPIKGSGEVTFFLHTTLWAFLPWSLFFAVAVWKHFRRPTANKLQYVITGSALITFLLFSFSRFQLPHYIIIILPLFAFLTAKYIATLDDSRSVKAWNMIQTILLVIAMVFIIGISYYSRLTDAVYAWLPSVLLLLFALVVYRRNKLRNVLMKTLMFSVALFLFMNLFFYPALLQYQSGTKAAHRYNSMNSPFEPAVFHNRVFSFQLHANRPVQFITDTTQLRQPVVVFTWESELPKLQQRGYRVEVVQYFDHFHIAMLTARFLNPATRSQELGRTVLLNVSPY